jgi:flagellar basal body rod protein FlgC
MAPLKKRGLRDKAMQASGRRGRDRGECLKLKIKSWRYFARRRGFHVSLRRMTDALSIAGSALAAQTISLAVTADNVANATTPGFTAKQAQFVPMNPGVSVGAIVDTGQSVDIADQMVNLILAKTAYQAAASVFRTANQMTNTLATI